MKSPAKVWTKGHNISPSPEKGTRHIPRVAVLSLGGTIAMVPDDTGLVAGLGARELLGDIPGLDAIARVEPQSLGNVASGALRFSDIADVADRIQNLLGDGVDGVVVIQGTDTLEEAAFVLDLLLDVNAPVVVTGALRSPALPGADGQANLLHAIRVAASPVAGELGVLVVMDEEIHAARFVRKMHTHKMSAFASPGAGPLGWITEDRVRIVLQPASRTPTIPWRCEPPFVPLVSMGLGMNCAAIESLWVKQPAGMVIAALGSGHVPPWIVDALASAAARVPVVFSSRTGSGECYRHTYAFPGGEIDLLRRGLIPGGFLDPAKARVLLSLLLADGADRQRIEEFFEWF